MTFAVLVLPRSGGWKKVRLIAFSLLAVLSLSIGVMEWQRSRLPELRIDGGTQILVIGDSISAGIGSEERCWPEVLQERLDRPVTSLAQAGATTADAQKQLAQISDPEVLVLVEIGGNDLLNGTDAATFEQALNRLLSGLANGRRRILMFELPLPPFCNGYGRAQRRAAERYGAVLLPKRYFARVLGMENGTLDGLHLSQAGQDALAGTLATVIPVPVE